MKLKSEITFKTPTKKSHIGDKKTLHLMDEVGCFSETKIKDNYNHLKFKKLNRITQLKEGMMVQVVESNNRPLHWSWIELTEKLITKISKQPKRKYIWIRMPNY